MTLIFFFGGGGGEEVRWKTVRTYGKILATPLSCKRGGTDHLHSEPVFRASRLSYKVVLKHKKTVEYPASPKHI